MLRRSSNNHESFYMTNIDYHGHAPPHRVATTFHCGGIGPGIAERLATTGRGAAVETLLAGTERTMIVPHSWQVGASVSVPGTRGRRRCDDRNPGSAASGDSAHGPTGSRSRRRQIHLQLFALDLLGQNFASSQRNR